MTTARSHALYRFYDTDGALLYVGITLDPGARWRTHRDDKPWWQQVASITIEIFSDRESVLAAERTVIAAEKPRYNVVHNHGRDVAPSTPAWGTRAEDMPDDCHDRCAKDGVLSIYFPHRWSNGLAHYTCARGHHWTCGWAHTGSGTAPEHHGRPFLQIHTEAVAQ